jgi:hypothetical protein
MRGLLIDRRNSLIRRHFRMSIMPIFATTLGLKAMSVKDPEELSGAWRGR